jgi:hypothetical protein
MNDWHYETARVGTELTLPRQIAKESSVQPRACLSSAFSIFVIAETLWPPPLIKWQRKISIASVN